MSSRSRAAAVIASWCSSAQSTLTSPAISLQRAAATRWSSAAASSRRRFSWLDTRPFTRCELEAQVGLARRPRRGPRCSASTARFDPGPVAEGGDGHEQAHAR